MGLALLARAKWKHNETVRGVTYIAGFCAVMAIIFGIIYDEVFGFVFWHSIGLSEFEVSGLHFPYHRAYEKESFIYSYVFFALGLGIGQLLIGLILGLINSIRERAIKHMVEKIGFIVLMVGSLTAIGANLKKLPPVLENVGIIAVFVAVVMIVYGGGLIGAIHILTVFGHVASYLRIAALGIAGVVLAFVAKKLAADVENIILGTSIAVLIHSLNLLMHSFSGTIHSIRLNVLEFFDKFYEPGGRPYKPFTTKRR